jgi:O-antigen ligase
MPFRYATHNHYLGLWFNLGLVGLLCGILLFVQLGRTARAAVDVTAGEYQSALMAFLIGLVALSTAVFFVDLYAPWPWFWAYAGLMTRIAVNARNAATVAAAQPQATAPAPPEIEARRADLYGWTARPQ